MPTVDFSQDDPAKAESMTPPYAPLPTSLVEELVSLLSEALTADFTHGPVEDASYRPTTLGGVQQGDTTEEKYCEAPRPPLRYME